MAETTTKIAIFASGTGTNADRIMAHFSDHPEVEISLVLTNKATAGVLSYADKHGIPSKVFDRKTFYESEHIFEDLRNKDIDWIVLAGFLWLMPAYLVRHYNNRIVNIHPALLPKYGGKGMFGINVHKAVAAAGEQHSGISIHYVNEKYDEGAIIFQASCDLEPNDSAEKIASKVRQLEHRYFPIVIESLVSSSDPHT